MPKSILDEDQDSVLDEASVTTNTPPAPVVTSSILDEDMQDDSRRSILSKLKENYNKVEEWASKPKPLAGAKSPVEFAWNYEQNLLKGVVGLGTGTVALGGLELGGLKEWITKPKESLAALKQGPSLINEMVLMPILEDVKDLFTHPIKYTYEKPIQQLLNLSIIGGIGAGVKGVQEAGKIGRATEYMSKASELIKAGDTVAGEIALNAAKGTMGTLRKPGIRALSPKYNALAEELEYQRWLETYSPMSSRGVKAGEYRFGKVTKISKKQQLGKWAGEVVDQPAAGGMIHPVPAYVTKKLGEGVTITDTKVASFRVTKPIDVKDVHGNKITLDKGHEFTEVHLSNNKVWLHDGKNIVIDKSTLQGLPKSSKLPLGEQKMFTPEEEAIKTIIKKGPSGRFEGEPIGPKFSEHTVPGGKNYREILFQAPIEDSGPFMLSKNLIEDLHQGKQIHMKNPDGSFTPIDLTPGDIISGKLDKAKNLYVKSGGPHYKSPHWEEPDIISHARITDRVTPDGKKIMFIEEIQSDWAKELRKQAEGTLAAGKIREAIPEQTLTKNWQEFTLKKLIKQAIDEGYDGISWTTGKQQAEHYNLAKRIDEIRYKRLGGETDGWKIDIIKGKEIIDSRPIQNPAELERFIGKDAAQKVIEQDRWTASGSILGKDLEIGGEWAKNLYDKQIPNILKDLTGEEPSKATFKVRTKEKLMSHEALQDLTDEELTRRLGNLRNQPNPEQLVDEFYNRSNELLDDLEGEGVSGDELDYRSWGEVLGMESSHAEEFVNRMDDTLESMRGNTKRGVLSIEQQHIPFTREAKARVLGEQPAAGGKGIEPPNKPVAVGGGPEGEEPMNVFERIREQAYADAPEVLPEGKVDAMNYERYLREKASGPVKKVIVKPEYQGDYYSLKPSVANLPKAKGDLPNQTSAIANHWMENLYLMKHPEHGQSFVSKNYKPQGDTPKPPERIYPWIKINTKAPMPQGESNALLRKIGSPGQVMREAWGLENPLVDAFEAGQTAGLNTENSFKWFKALTKGIKTDSQLIKERMSPFIKEHISLSRKWELTTDEGLKKSLSDMISKNYKDAYDFQLKMAETSPDIRIAMYAEDILPAKLLPMMSEQEVKIGEMVKSYYAKTAEDMKRVGLPILSKQAYSRHIIAQEMKEAMGNYMAIPDYIKKHILADMAFAHRSGEFNWYPSVTAQLSDYIPVVERKLAFQPYLIHWKDTVDKASKLGNKAAIEAAEMIKRNIYQGSNLSNKISNGITSTNYFLQLFANARVAVKHIIGGFPGAISEVGLWNTPAAVYQLVTQPLKSQEMLKTFGKLKEIIKTLEVTSGIEIQSSRILRAIQGQPTIAAEYVESGINIMGNLMKGSMKGVDPELLRSYIWNKVTSVNFRGGWDIPKVFANPAGRILFQYSLEPHKVWEYRAELVKRALNGERDIYGTTYGSKLIQYIALTGAAEALARAHGKTLLDTIGGTPYIDFISPKKDFPYINPQAKVKLGPGVKLLADTSKDIARGDVVHVTDEFINYILESGVGLLGQLSKVRGGKIPDYYEDAYDYLLGFPEVDRLERMSSRTKKYLDYRSEKDELMRERSLIRKNPILKNFVLFKRDFRKSLRKFLENPDKHIEGVYGTKNQGSILDEGE